MLPAWPRDVLEAVLVSNVLKKKQTLEDLTLTKGSIRMLLLDDKLPNPPPRAPRTPTEIAAH